MNSSTIRHPFAVRAALLSMLITSTMALIPTLAGAGVNRDTHNVQMVQTVAAPAQQVNVAG
jgi:hypothetical protein